MKIFDQLADKPVTAETVANHLKLSLKGVERLLNALAGMEIVVKENNLYHLPDEWKKYLTQNGGHSLQQWIELIGGHFSAWMDLPKFVQTGQNVRNVLDMLGNEPAKMEAFTNAMHDKGVKATWLMAREIPVGEAKHMLDVGGGPGTYSLEWAKLHPHLKATIFDIAPVLAITKKYIARYGLQDRVDTKPGDFHKDALGTGYDLVLLANVLHMYEEDLSKKLVRKAVDALVPGGRIIIHGLCTDDNDISPLNDVMFSLNMGLLTPGGRAHPVREKIQWLEESGIHEIRHFRIGAIPTGVITGIKKK